MARAWATPRNFGSRDLGSGDAKGGYCMLLRSSVPTHAYSFGCALNAESLHPRQVADADIHKLVLSGDTGSSFNADVRRCAFERASPSI